MLLGVIYHALLFGGGMMAMFGGTPGPDARLMEWIHSFRMPMFFLISGFFCHMMFAKYGAGKYLWRRWWRLGAAMLIYLFVVAGISKLTGGGNSPFGPPGGGPPGQTRGPGTPGFQPGPGGDGAPRGPGGDFGPDGAAPGRPQGAPPAMAGGPRPSGPGGFPGGGGGPGGPPRGPGGPGGFGPGMILGGTILEQADGNADQQVSREELATLAETWFTQLDTDKTGKLSAYQFAARFGGVFRMPPGMGPPGGGGGPGGGGPGDFLGRMFGPGVFRALDADEDGSLLRDEMKAGFNKWFGEWADGGAATLSREALSAGLTKALPQPQFGPPGGRGGGGPGGPGGMPFGMASPLADRLFGDMARSFNLGPMWFIWYLLVFATAALPVSWAAGKLRLGDSEKFRNMVPWALRFGLVALVLAVISLPARMQTGGYGGWTLGGAMGIFQAIPDVFLRYQADWPFYFSYFLVGWWLFTARTALGEIGRTWLPALVIGFGAYVAAVKFSEAYSRDTGAANYALLRVAGHGLFTLSGAFLSFGFLGFFQRFFDRPTKLGRYLADTAFWFYLLHQELLIQVILPRLRPYGLPWWAQCSLAVLIVALVAAVTFELFIRRTPLTHLFGPPPKKKPAAVAVPGATGGVTTAG